MNPSPLSPAALSPSLMQRVQRLQTPSLPSSASSSQLVNSIQSSRSEGTRAAVVGRSSTKSLEEKLLQFLAHGCSNEDAAMACGISVSRVTQIATEPEFAAALAEARFKNSIQYQERDGSWDSAEDKLLEKLHGAIPTMHKPQDILRALQVVNGAKRRAENSPDRTSNSSPIVNLILPAAATARFITNAQNQVVQTGEQSLVTIQSGALTKMAAASIKGQQNDRTILIEQTPEGSSES